MASSILASAPDAIPFRAYAVAESTGTHDNKGASPFRPPLLDSACETPFPPRKPATHGIVDGKPTFQAESLATPKLSERQRLAVRWADRFLSDHLRVISGDDTQVERLRSISRRWGQPIPATAMPRTSSKGLRDKNDFLIGVLHRTLTSKTRGLGGRFGGFCFSLGMLAAPFRSSA